MKRVYSSVSALHCAGNLWEPGSFLGYAGSLAGFVNRLCAVDHSSDDHALE